MLRSIPQALRRPAARVTALAAAAALMLPAAVRAQDNRPVVVVYAFNNSSIGAGSADFNGVQTGIQDLLITDLASNSKYRLVDRARINQILQEQGMVKTQQIDPATAVRLGKIMGAQYAITGGFMSTASGEAVLTGYTIDIETTQISNGQKIQGKSSDVLGIINQLSTRLASNMTLAPKPGAPARRTGDAGEAQKPAAAPAQSGAPTAGAPTAQAQSNVERFAKPVSEKARRTKLDAASLKTYSNALDEIDKKNVAKARTLLEQVVRANPDFEQAKNQLEKLGH